MRLTLFSAQNYLTHRARAFEFDRAPALTIVAGDNGTGKSAIAQGIKLALTGKPVRGLAHKKDLSELITQGEDKGSIVIHAIADGVEGVWQVNLKSGSCKGGELGAVPYSLDPATFLAMPAGERRKALFDLTGTRVSPDAAKEILVEAGFAAAAVDRVYHHFRLGLPAAAEQARELASQARGAWRAITNETYGAEKAATWRAPTPAAVDPAELAELSAANEKAEFACGVRQEKLSELLAELKAWESYSARPVHDALKLQDELDAVTTKVDMLQGRVDALSAAASAPRVRCVSCPACGALLEQAATGELRNYERRGEPEKPPSDAAAELPTARHELSAALKRQATLSAQLDAPADRGQAPTRPSDEAIARARQDLAGAKTAHALASSNLDAAEAAAKAHEAAVGKTRAAASHHADVGAFTRLAEALDALPERFNQQVLQQVNALCAEASAALPKPVTFDNDMEPRYGSIRYGLASRSQRWCVEFAVGYALAVLSGLRVLVLDEFDLLLKTHRFPVLKWLAGRENFQTILCASLVDRPTIPPHVAQVVWLS